MRYKPKKYKKFIAPAATATLVASALEPKENSEELSDEEYYNLMVEGYSEMANEPTIDQEIEAGLKKYVDGILAENAKLREALEFYADKGNYNIYYDDVGIIGNDNGDKAQQALRGESK